MTTTRRDTFFWDRVDMTPNTTFCWLWRGRIEQDGYGSTSIQGKTQRAHRAVYEQIIGAVPRGLVLDHLCRNRACVNPLHLEPVTTRENVLRGSGLAAKNAKRTHCKKGHMLTRSGGRTKQRYCAICKTEWSRNKARALGKPFKRAWTLREKRVYDA